MAKASVMKVSDGQYTERGDLRRVAWQAFNFGFSGCANLKELPDVLPSSRRSRGGIITIKVKNVPKS